MAALWPATKSPDGDAGAGWASCTRCRSSVPAGGVTKPIAVRKPPSRFALSWCTEQGIAVARDETRVDDVYDAEHEIERDPEYAVQ